MIPTMLTCLCRGPRVLVVTICLLLARAVGLDTEDDRVDLAGGASRAPAEPSISRRRVKPTSVLIFVRRNDPPFLIVDVIVELPFPTV